MYVLIDMILKLKTDDEFNSEVFPIEIRPCTHAIEYGKSLTIDISQDGEITMNGGGFMSKVGKVGASWSRVKP